MIDEVHKPHVFCIDQIFLETYLRKSNILIADATNYI